MRAKSRFESMNSFKRFTLMWVLLILLACVILGLSLMSAGLFKLEEVNEAQGLELLRLFARDLETQNDAMHNATLRMSVSLPYQSFFRAQGSYYDLEITDDFQKYQDQSPIADEAFLLFTDDDKVFIRNATNPFAVYAKNVLGVDDPGALYERINGVGKPLVVRLDGKVIFVYPFPVGRTENAQSAALVSFVCSDETLARRARVVCGYAGGTLRIRARGESWSVTVGDASHRSKVLSAVSENGLFALEYTFDRNSFQGVLSWFVVTSVGITVMMIALFAAAARVLASYNYRPIRRIVDRYDLPSHPDDFTRIELLLRDTVTKYGATEQALQENRRKLRQKEIYLLLLGGSGITSGVQMELDAACVLVVRLRPPPPDGMDRLSRQIAFLAQERMRFYTVEMRQEDMLVVWADFGGESTPEDAADLIDALLETCDTPYTLGVGRAFTDVEDSGESFISAVASCERDEKSDIRWYDERLKEQLAHAVREGDEALALDRLAALLRQMEATRPGVIVRRCMIMDVVNTLIRLSDELGRPLSRGVINPMLSCVALPSLHGIASPVVTSLCHSTACGSADRLESVLAYIQEHVLEYDMSKERVARHFQMTESSLYRLLHDGIHQTYVAYVTSLRVERAKRLLGQAGSTVASVAEQVGYTNTSHFIKIFKQTTGCTPATYKARSGYDGGAADSEK